MLSDDSLVKMDVEYWDGNSFLYFVADGRSATSRCMMVADFPYSRSEAWGMAATSLTAA